MYLDFVHNDWICSCHDTHEFPNDIIKSNDKLNCTCSDEKYIINWNYRDDPDAAYDPLNKSIKINTNKKTWYCPKGHEYEIDTPIIRSHDTLICSECKEQYQFAPTISISSDIMSKLKDRVSSLNID